MTDHLAIRPCKRWARLAAVAASLGTVACTTPAPAPAGGDVRGGTLRVAVRAEPQTWNRLLAVDDVTHAVTDQLHVGLVRLDPHTQRVEPAVAESWSYHSGGGGAGVQLRFRLRDDVRFSDGEPLDASDVVFTFELLHDPAIGSQLAAAAQVDGVPLQAERFDSRTVGFRIPRRTAALERIFDGIAILPEHLLRESWEAGELLRDTGIGAPKDRIVGLGPFVLESHVPGERVQLRANPYYYRTEETEEVSYPKLERISFEVVPDESARVLRLRSGEVDLVLGLSPGVFHTLSSSEESTFEALDAGPGAMSERLWFNLNPKSPIEETKRTWFQSPQFRRAVSLAIDRRSMATSVYRGLATPASGPVSPANPWHDPTLVPVEQNVGEALRLLRASGFELQGESLVDRNGTKVEFTLLTGSGNPLRERIGAALQEDLRHVGISMRVVAIESGSLLSRLTSTFDFESVLLGISSTDPDPSAEMSLWMSAAPLHLWHPLQTTPRTEWEARIDTLMRTQADALEHDTRLEAFREVQRIVARQLPVLDLIVPHTLLAARKSVKNLRPTPFRHALWNSDELVRLPE